MKEQETKDVSFKTTNDLELSSQHKQQSEDDRQQQQLTQIVNVSYQGDQVATGSTYEQVVNEDSYSQEVGDYEGEQNETEYYEEFETSVVQPEEQVQVEIVGVEVNLIHCNSNINFVSVHLRNEVGIKFPSIKSLYNYIELSCRLCIDS